jgi:hypothetical protein
MLRDDSLSKTIAGSRGQLFHRACAIPSSSQQNRHSNSKESSTHSGKVADQSRRSCGDQLIDQYAVHFWLSLRDNLKNSTLSSSLFRE